MSRAIPSTLLREMLDAEHGFKNCRHLAFTDRCIRYRSGKFFDNLADETISDAIEFVIKIVANRTVILINKLISYCSIACTIAKIPFYR
jgi:hypothetical protein